jgi:Fur family peroxide stress response transcriptional regulator
MNKKNTRNANPLIEDKIQAFKALCHKNGLKITPQRVAIYRRLLLSVSHPTATDIYNRVLIEYPNISLGTVNSSLLAFLEKGMICIIGASGDPKRFEGNLDRHDHLRCTKCRRIIDLDCKIAVNIRVPANLRNKYLITGSKLLLEGRCDKCR